MKPKPQMLTSEKRMNRITFMIQPVPEYPVTCGERALPAAFPAGPMPERPRLNEDLQNKNFNRSKFDNELTRDN